MLMSCNICYLYSCQLVSSFYCPIVHALRRIARIVSEIILFTFICTVLKKKKEVGAKLCITFVFVNDILDSYYRPNLQAAIYLDKKP